MRRIVTVTRTVTHFVDIAIDDAATDEEAKAAALEMAGDDHRYWDERCEERPWVLAVRSGEP